MSADELVNLLNEGRLVPGARLMALAEASLAHQGGVVRHFGNTYGHTAMASRILQVPAADAIPFHDDDADSWHYAVIANAAQPDRHTYPLHLLDIIGCSAVAKAAVAELVEESMRRNGPVVLEPKESLDATLFVGRSGLLRQEDGRARSSAGDA